MERDREHKPRERKRERGNHKQTPHRAGSLTWFLISVPKVMTWTESRGWMLNDGAIQTPLFIPETSGQSCSSCMVELLSENMFTTQVGKAE